MTPYDMIIDKLEARGETKYWLAEKLDINYSTLTGYKGRKKIPFDIWVKSAIILNIDLNIYKSLYEGFEPDPLIKIK